MTLLANLLGQADHSVSLVFILLILGVIALILLVIYLFRRL